MPLSPQPNVEQVLRTARLDLREARDLLAYVLQKPVSFLVAHPQAQLTRTQITVFKQLATRRRRGVPFAYLTGSKGFYGLGFAVTKDVLIPRPETEQLIDWVVQHYRNRNVTIADVGTGSGCIAVTLAKFLPKAKLFASDVSEKALAVAKTNARLHDVAKRITFRIGSLLSPIKPAEPLDLVVANLPYLTKEQLKNVPHEPKLALHGGTRGLELVTKLLWQIAERQIPAAIFEIDPQQERWLETPHAQLPYEETFKKDFGNRTRFLVLTAKQSTH